MQIVKPSLLLVSLATVGLFACDKGGEGLDAHADDGDTHADADADADHDADTGEADESGDTDAEGCAAETRDDDFALGLSKSGTQIQASFISADPAPPIKGDNTWVLEILDLEGQPLLDATVTALPMMPDHGHGTPVAAEVSALETPGRYEITPVNLFMTGYWQITFDVTLASGDQDSVMFGFCVE